MPQSTAPGAVDDFTLATKAVRDCTKVVVGILSKPGRACFATFRVLVYRQLLPFLVSARPLLGDDELRSIAVAAVRAGPVRFDSAEWLRQDDSAADGLDDVVDDGTALHIAWLSDAGSVAARLDLVRSLSSSWLLTEPVP